MKPPSTENKCRACGAPLAGAGEQQFCPACMWRDFTATDPEEEAGVPADALFTVAGHDVLAEIARGGGGIVYRARQREPRREVALKMLLPHQTTSEEMHVRFRVETKAIAALEHRAILPVYLVGEHRGMPFFTMKLATAGTLAARRDALSGAWQTIAGLAATIADAVQFAHGHGVIHRDLKPGNVLFDADGQPYVSDFGLAKFLAYEANSTGSRETFGTPAYLAPEIAEHGGAAATTATDIYGLGAILYELLAGRPPFEAESLPALVRKLVEDPPPPGKFRPSVPRDLAVIALRCLAKNPAHRFATAAELATDLRRWLEGRPILSRPVAAHERLWRWARRNPALAVLSALSVASLVTGGTLVLVAEREVRAQLQVSLISEARLMRRSGQVGQRAAALARLDRAATLGPVASLRSEYIAALVRQDLVLDLRRPTPHARSDYTLDFSGDLARMIEVAEEGNGFIEREVVTGKTVRRFEAGPGEVWYLSYAADGAMVTAAYRDGRTEVWELGATAPWWTGGELYGQDAQPAPLAVHPTGQSLARVGSDDNVRRVDRALNTESTVIPAAGEVRLLSFNPSGDVLLIVHRDQATAWSWPEGRRLWSFAGVMSPARPAWTSDGRRLVVGMTGGDDIAMLDARTGQVERRFKAHGVDARLLAFQPGGRLLASVGWDGRLALLDAFTGELVLQREAWVRTLRFSADGRRLAFSSSHVEAAIASLAVVDCLRELGNELVTEHVACRLTVSADGRWVVSADFTTMKLWDARTGQLLVKRTEPKPEWSVVAFSAAGDAVIQSRRFSGLVRWPLLVTGGSGGETAALGASEPLAPGKPGDLVRIDGVTGDWWILRFDTGELVTWPRGRPEAERAVLTLPGLDAPGLSPDARLVACRNYPGPGLRVMETATGRAIASLAVPQTLVSVFTPDGKFLLTGSSQSYRMWATANWQPTAAWAARIEGGSYGRASYAPDGRLVAVQQDRGTIELRETKDYRLLLQLELPNDPWIHHFEWAPDGSRIYAICLGHRVLYWDMRAIRHELAIRGLAWE